MAYPDKHGNLTSLKTTDMNELSISYKVYCLYRYSDSNFSAFPYQDLLTNLQRDRKSVV